MAENLTLDPESLAAIEDLYDRADRQGDPRAKRLADRLDKELDKLEERPIPADARARYLRPPGLWMIPVYAGDDGDDWAVLWDLSEDDVAQVRYIGPASFA